VRNQEETLVRTEQHSIGPSDSGVYYAFFTLCVDKPNLLGGWIRNIDLTFVGDSQIVRVEPFSNDCFFTIHVISHNPLPAILAGIKLAIRPEHQAIGAPCVFLEN